MQFHLLIHRTTPSHVRRFQLNLQIGPKSDSLKRFVCWIMAFRTRKLSLILRFVISRIIQIQTDFFSLLIPFTSEMLTTNGCANAYKFLTPKAAKHELTCSNAKWFNEILRKVSILPG